MLLAWVAFAGFLFLCRSLLAAPAVPELDPRTVGSWPIGTGGISGPAGTTEPRRDTAGIAYAAPYAFLASRSLGLEVIDTTVPERPVKVAAWLGARDAVAVVLSADHRHAFVASQESDVHVVYVVDVSDPLRPKRIDAWVVPGYLHGITRRGNLALVTIQDRAFQVVDVSVPANPHILYDGFPQGTTLQALDTASVGNHVFVIDRQRGILVYDLSDPSQPRPITTLKLTGASRIAIVEPFAYVDTDAGFVTLDITDPTAPVKVDLQPGPIFDVKDMIAVEDVLAVACPQGLIFFDIHDRQHPKRLGVAVSYTPSGVVHDGKHFVASLLGAGIRIVDIARSSPMSWVGQLDSISKYSWIGASGRNVAAVMESGSAQLHLIHVPPSAPLQDLGGLPIVGRPLAMMFHGDLLLCVEGAFMMTIYDVSNPSVPRLLSEPAAVAYHASLTSDGNLLYLVAGGNPPREFYPEAEGLVVFDLTDPANPVRRSRLKTPGDPYAIAVTNDLGYLTVGPEGLAVLDLKNPDQPSVLGQVPTGGQATDIEMVKGCAFVTTASKGIQIFDLSQPHTPRPIASILPGQTIQSTAYQGDFALVQTDALHIFDITDPSHPTRVGGFTTIYGPRFSQQSLLPNGDLLVVSYADGVSVLRLHPMFKSWSRTDQGTRLEWYSTAGVRLQSSPTIGASAWDDVPGTDTSTVYLAPTDGVNRTFRLSRP